MTQRQSEVLYWVSEGKTAWEIAVILGISRRTVEEHIVLACRKLNAVNRCQVVAIAIRKGWI